MAEQGLGHERRAHVARVVGVGLALVAAAVAVWRLGPIVRGPQFHVYADHRTELGVPNALDVLTNLPFLVVGLVGLLRVRRLPRHPAHGLPRWVLSTLFASIVAVGLGSGVYHLRPNDATLILDWLPIAVMFMTFLAILISDRIHLRTGVHLSAPFGCLGAGTALWWFGGQEWSGAGDMRWYVLVQLAGAVALVAVMVLFPRGRMKNRDLAVALLAYFVAKVLARRDALVLAATGGLVSGHSLKHLAAALGTALILRAVRPYLAEQAQATSRPATSPASAM